jgi:hypothetical protein
MGLLGRIGGWFRRFGRRLSETDEVRLAEETRAWADGVQATVRIADAPRREPVRLAGIVSRITVVPTEGKQAVEALVTDGTGEVTAAWLGRSSIPGMVLGTRLILEGVIGETRDGRRIVNPAPSICRCAVTTRATGRATDAAGSGRAIRGRTSGLSTVTAGMTINSFC